LLNQWVDEFLRHISEAQPQFIGIHLQEVGGKTYEKSLEHVAHFIKVLCESSVLADFERIRIYLDEDFSSAEHFTVIC
jgi:inositol polyphosphate 5-phosphatase INPP5A